MFFPERIRSIQVGDMVLEVGPGGSPYPRSNVLLEKSFLSESEAEGQRGYAKPLASDKKIVYFNGGRFPFEDQAFDYVICSHVLEHVPAEEVPFFLDELSRVAPRGYLEFPTVYYDYIYNFPEHVTLLLHRSGTVNFIGKAESGLDGFAAVHRLFYESLKAGRNGMANELKQYFFQGFEWEKKIPCRKAVNIEDVTLSSSEIDFTPVDARSNHPRSLARQMLRWFK